MSGEGVVRLGDLAAGPVRRRWTPEEVARKAMAARLGLKALPELEAELEVRPWMDGCEVTGRFRARVTQVCGVTLEAFDQAEEGEIAVRLVPEGSPHLPVEPAAGEIEISLESPDPPEVLAGDGVDLYALVEEHLALEIDPFPRRPDAVFNWTPEDREDSPFAALRALKTPKA